MRDARLSVREPHAVPEQIKHIAAVLNRFGEFLVNLRQLRTPYRPFLA